MFQNYWLSNIICVILVIFLLSDAVVKPDDVMTTMQEFQLSDSDQ